MVEKHTKTNTKPKPHNNKTKIKMENQKQKLFIPIAPCVLQRLNYFLQTKKIPHLLFHGKSGTGKRTIVNQFIREILDHDQKRIENNVLYVNCAHEKGIQFIRCEIKNFARINVQYVIPKTQTQTPKSKNELFKIIVLQNADKLTIDAQSALRRSIEIYSNNTRFFIIVENIQKILNPILSRFCEIYVPERMDTQGNTICLHQLPELLHATTNTSNLPSTNTSNPQQQQHLILSFLQDPTPHKAVSVSTLFYEEGLSCYELLNNLKPMMRPKHFSSVEMEFQKIKSEFRCEKLLVFYLLIFLTTLC
jgi:Cdc6-like AAA superfamily ATPase